MTEPSFSSALDEQIASSRRGGGECPVGVALRTMSPEDASRLQAALASSMDHVVITRALRVTLRPTGVTVGEAAVSKHRRKECRCG